MNSESDPRSTATATNGGADELNPSGSAAQPPTQTRPTNGQGKTIFLLASMAGWLLVGGALIYLAPVMANRFFHSATTEVWMETLNRGGYNPMLAVVGGSVVFVVTVIGHLIWSPKFGQTR